MKKVMLMLMHPVALRAAAVGHTPCQAHLHRVDGRLSGGSGGAGGQDGRGAGAWPRDALDVVDGHAGRQGGSGRGGELAGAGTRVTLASQCPPRVSDAHAAALLKAKRYRAGARRSIIICEGQGRDGT